VAVRVGVHRSTSTDLQIVRAVDPQIRSVERAHVKRAAAGGCVINQRSEIRGTPIVVGGQDGGAVARQQLQRGVRVPPEIQSLDGIGDSCAGVEREVVVVGLPGSVTVGVGEVGQVD